MQPEIREQLERRSLPRFTTNSLENDFRDSLFESKRTLTRNSLLLAIILFAAVEPTVRAWLPSDIAATDNAVRWLLNVPATIVALAACQLLHDKVWLERIFISCLGVMLLGNAVLLWSSGAEQKLYYAIAGIQITLFGFFLLGLRFKPTFLCMLLCFAGPSICAFIAIFAERSGLALQSPYLMAILIFFGLAFAAHSLDLSNRTVFFVNLARSRDYARRLELEQERSRWLKVGSDYLNHEVKNALLGMTSSLSLIRRRNTDDALSDYIERAERSSVFMKRLLSEVSTSTSLESTLEAAVRERTNLAELLSARAVEYRSLYPNQRFELTTQDNTCVLCDIDRIVQVLDNLVANATEHGDPSHPIRISLQHSDSTALLSIANIGEPLPGSESRIFEPFVSGKERSTDSGFGFGLYIAKRIIEAHNGTITAKSMANPDGAEFIVQLPLDNALE